MRWFILLEWYVPWLALQILCLGLTVLAIARYNEAHDTVSQLYLTGLAIPGCIIALRWALIIRRRLFR